jgi:hypothetical protein
MLLGLLILIMSVNAFGVGFIGAPKAELKKSHFIDEWDVGLNFTYMDTEFDEVKITGGEQTFDENGKLMYSESSPVKLKLYDVKNRRYYCTVGYGLTDSWEAYIQFGIAEVKFRSKDADDPNADSTGYNLDNDFAFGLGTKYTFREQGDVCWGASLQVNWLDASWDETSYPSGALWEETYKQQVDLETYDLLIAVGPIVDMGGWELYGGPFYYYLSGDLSISGDRSSIGIYGFEVREGYSGDFENDSSFGGFVGAQVKLEDIYDMTAELSFTGDGWAIGTGIACKF